MYRIIRIAAATLALSAALVGCSAQEVTDQHARYSTTDVYRNMVETHTARPVGVLADR